MHISMMKNVFSPIDPLNQLTLSWDDIVKKLTYFNESKTKEQTPMFNLWQFKTLKDGAELGRKYDYDTEGNKLETYKELPNTIRRCAKNAIGLWGLVLDYDGKKTIEEALIEMDGIECVIYTTFRHTLDLHKFRVVMPFTRMVSLEEFELVQEDMHHCFPFADAASFSISQAIYLHSGLDKSISISGHLSGNKIDPDIFVATEKEEQSIKQDSTSTSMDQYEFNKYQISIMNSLLTCRDIHRGATKTNGGGLTLALICKSIGVTFDVFQQVCSTVTSSDSCLRDNATQRQIWNEVVGDRITRQKRDKFILENNGVLLK